MKRQDFWRLTVAFWPAATAAGVRPCVAHGFEEGPRFYSPHDIDFANKSTREDYLAVVKMTPWMSVWEKRLLPIIATNTWPVVGPYHKAAQVELLNAEGQVVGELRVYRQTLYVNGGSAA